MSYADAIAHLNSLAPELFTAPIAVDAPAGTVAARRKFSLHEIGVLCTALGEPQRRFPAVLIAGTNGKGSTAATLASIACSAGLRVGLYTSPHLDRVNERIRLLLPGSEAPALIEDEVFARLYFEVLDAAQRLVQEGLLDGFPSYFEVLTALAFLYFAAPGKGEPAVDLAVLEVGMGGRLDATNIVEPVVSVITDISLDHQEWLGDTIDLIAREKAGILRRGGVLVTLPQHPEANQAIGEIATALEVRGVAATAFIPAYNAPAMKAYELEIPGPEGAVETAMIDSPLHGQHQQRNAALAIAAALELNGLLGLRAPRQITPAAIAEGVRRTSWPGRLESMRVAGQPEFLLDVAHNPAGAWALRAALNADDRGGGRDDQRTVLIFGCLRDKPVRELAQILFPLFGRVILAPINSPRAASIEDLLAAAVETGTLATAVSSVGAAIALAESERPSRVVISGSVYLVGEARRLLLQQQGASVSTAAAQEEHA